MLPKTLFWLILVGVCLFAVVRGRREEWIIAAVCAIGSLATILVSPRAAAGAISTEVMLIDLAALVAFIAVALGSRRFWPLWAAGFQLASATVHLLIALEADLVPRAYAAAERFWIYPIFLAIVIGTWRAGRDRAAATAAPGAVRPAH